MRHIHIPNFVGIVFRKTNVQIKGEGGLWTESEGLYRIAGAVGYRHDMRWIFPSGAAMRFGHLEHEDDKFKYQGHQYAYIAFDELTHFSESQFWYMSSRNRSMSGVQPYIRATCNPDADSWVAELISWWIDQETGYAIEERSGVIRWFAMVGDDRVWADTKQELIDLYPECSPKSLTFIRSKLEDNKLLMAKDPNYLANLKNLPKLDRERLLMGNWKIKATAGQYFQASWFEQVPAPPEPGIVARCRYWDRAGGKPKPGKPRDWTVGLLLARDARGVFYVEDVQRFQESAHIVEQRMVNTAKNDPKGTIVAYMQDPGSAGENEAQSTARALSGFNVRFEKETGSKEIRAKPASAQVEAGNVKIVQGASWIAPFLRELENFPDGANDDQVDAFSGAFNEIALNSNFVTRVEKRETDRMHRTERGKLLF